MSMRNPMEDFENVSNVQPSVAADTQVGGASTELNGGLAVGWGFASAQVQAVTDNTTTNLKENDDNGIMSNSFISQPLRGNTEGCAANSEMGNYKFKRALNRSNLFQQARNQDNLFADERAATNLSFSKPMGLKPNTTTHSSVY